MPEDSPAEEMEEHTKLDHSSQVVRSEEMFSFPLREFEDVQKANEACPIIEEISIPARDSQTVDVLTAEVEMLKKMLQIERQRANDSERKYTESMELSERRRKKLEETEKRVYQLQDSLNRLLYSMSDQFLQLKTILRSPLISTSASAAVVRDELVDTSDNSDASSSDSDFTFPAPSPTSANFSSFSSSPLQLIVQDLSGKETKGSNDWKGEKEGAFDDYF